MSLNDCEIDELKRIIDELSIPRKMGSEGEKKSRESIQKLLQDYNIKVKFENFSYADSINYFMKSIFLLVIIFIIYLNFIRSFSPWITFTSIVIFFVVIGYFGLRLLNFKIPLIGKKQTGYNIIFELNQSNIPRNTILLSAHYDSISSKIPPHLYKLLFFITGIKLLVFASLIFISNIGELIGISENIINWSDTLTFYLSIFIIIIISILILNKKENKSPGACDNGSGVLILIQLAKILKKENALINSHLIFLFSGAEELGLWGSRHFFTKRKEELLKNKLNFFQINVDMVGSEIAYLSKKGLISRKPLNKILNSIIERQALKLNLPIRPFSSMIGSSSDHAIFLKEQFEVANFTSMKDKQIHSKNDIVDRLNLTKIQEAIILLKNVIYYIDQENYKNLSEIA